MPTCWVKRAAFLIVCAWVLPVEIVNAQDIEPRRWTPMPIGLNVIGAAYVYTQGDIGLDPVLLLEDVKQSSHGMGVSYARSVSVFGRSARIDAIVPVASVHWKGLLDGSSASTSRKGLVDPSLRFSINLYGAPAMNFEEFKQRSVSLPVNTVIGAALIVRMPLGNYDEDKLLNLGQNRFMLRPQIGVLHTHGKWSYEFTASAFIYSDNDEFFGGNTRKQDPMLAAQGHVIRVFDRGYWVSLSAAYGWDGESFINEVPKDDGARNIVGALSFGVPLNKTQGLKFTYLARRTNTNTGADLNSFGVGWSKRF